jgi:hypothetical protein
MKSTIIITSVAAIAVVAGGAFFAFHKFNNTRETLNDRQVNSIRFVMDTTTIASLALGRCDGTTNRPPVAPLITRVSERFDLTEEQRKAIYESGKKAIGAAGVFLNGPPLTEEMCKRYQDVWAQMYPRLVGMSKGDAIMEWDY